ncbi:hypothetical protein ABWH91_06595 [Phycisphaerales bacterium ac7]
MTPEHAPSDGGPQRLNPAAMSPADAARVLTRVGGSPVTEDMLRADIAAVRRPTRTAASTSCTTPRGSCSR